MVDRSAFSQGSVGVRRKRELFLRKFVRLSLVRKNISNMLANCRKRESTFGGCYFDVDSRLRGNDRLGQVF